MRTVKLVTIIAAAVALLLSPLSVAPASAAIPMEYDQTTIDGRNFQLSNDSWCLLGRTAGACFDPVGDYLWVSDRLGDGHAGAIYWRNYYPGDTLYRNGACIERGGEGSYGLCNKNFIENSKLQFRACSVEWSTKETYDCTGWHAVVYADGR